MSVITTTLAVLSVTALMVMCRAQQLNEGPSTREKRASGGFDWPSESSYLSQQHKRGFGTLKFGKRPFGSIKFGKREPEANSPFSDEFSQRENPDWMLHEAPSKRYSDMLDNLYFQSLINNLKTPDDIMWNNKRMVAANVGDNKRAKIKFGKKSFGPVANELMTDKERNLKDSRKSPYTSF